MTRRRKPNKLSRQDRRALKRYNKATGADKSADERFAGMGRPTSTHHREPRRPAAPEDAA